MPSNWFYPGYPSAAAWMHPALAISTMNTTSMAKFTWRKGKWTEEEESYTKKLIDAFNQGYLKIASGTTLRSFLAERLFWFVCSLLALSCLILFFELLTDLWSSHVPSFLVQ